MIAELDDLKAIGNITVTDDDTVLQDLLEAADMAARSYCDRNFESSTVIEYHNGNGLDKLMLNEYPIIVISSVYDDVDRAYNAATLLDSNDIVIDPDVSGQIIYDGGVFTLSGYKNIKVTYTYGYTKVNMPKDLKLAVAKLALADYLDTKAGVNAMKTEEGDTRSEKLREEAYKTFDRYRRIV